MPNYFNYVTILVESLLVFPLMISIIITWNEHTSLCSMFIFFKQLQGKKCFTIVFDQQHFILLGWNIISVSAGILVALLVSEKC